MSNLRLIKQTEADSVSSISLTNCFSADFDVYKIDVVMDGTTTNKHIMLQYINSSGAIDTTANYSTGALFMSSYTDFIQLRYNGQSSHLVTGYNYDGGTGIEYTIFNPFSSSLYTALISQSSGAYNSSGVKMVGTTAVGLHLSKTSMTGINIVPSASTLKDVKVKVYGYRVD